MSINNFHNRFSLPHPDRWKNPEIFHERLANADDQYRHEIADIYFGMSFHYNHNGEQRTYGEVMGAQASENAYRSLLDIQERFGIPISLTINAVNQPRELVENRDILNQFIDFISRFYGDGVRRCTISHIHLMNLGVLQESFPRMHWKNTVNNHVRSAQEFIDYIGLGYSTVVLDRSLNRDLDELARIKVLSRKYGVHTCLLAHEGCIPACPFKHEHDSWQAGIEKSESMDYWQGIGNNTCGLVRRGRTAISKHDRHVLPRATTDLVWTDREDFDAYADVVDVFKFWGRLSSEPPQGHKQQVSCWLFRPASSVEWCVDRPIWASSFEEIYNADLLPFNAWVFNSYVHGRQTDRNWNMIQEASIGSVWLTPEGKSLSRLLRDCRSQCYRCHACEALYGLEPFDSIIGWRNSDKRNEHLFKQC